MKIMNFFHDKLNCLTWNQHEYLHWVLERVWLEGKSVLTPTEKTEYKKHYSVSTSRILNV